VPKGPASRGLLSIFARVLEDARHAGKSIDAGIHENADLIDQSSLQEGTIDRAAALEKESTDPDHIAKYVHNTVQVTPVSTREQVGHAIFLQLR
jgi:hypothetical protein